MNSFRTLIKKSCWLFLLLFLFDLIDFAQEKTEIKYIGNFENELIADTRELHMMLFESANKAVGYKFTNHFENGAKLKIGNISDPREAKKQVKIFLAEPPKGNPYICFDSNNNFEISKDECQTMPGAKGDSEIFEQTIRLPINAGKFKTFPVYLRFKRDFTHPNLKAGDRVVEQSSGALAVGFVDVNKQKIYVGYEFNLASPMIDPTSGLLTVDVNSDGKFDNFPFSKESAYASEKEIVFRIGEKYLSTETADLSKNQIVMRPRRKDEYVREEFEIGKEMKDFPFVDFDNKKRSLSDFRGKYLLLDFWGLWCVDCRQEIPYQMQAYNLYRSRGFEILAMDTDDETEKVKAVLEKNQINWTQARYDSIKDLIETNYGIQQYPSTILLSPEGKVLILEQEKLKGKELLKTLDRLLPK